MPSQVEVEFAALDQRLHCAAHEHDRECEQCDQPKGRSGRNDPLPLDGTRDDRCEPEKAQETDKPHEPQ